MFAAIRRASWQVSRLAAEHWSVAQSPCRRAGTADIAGSFHIVRFGAGHEPHNRRGGSVARLHRQRCSRLVDVGVSLSSLQAGPRPFRPDVRRAAVIFMLKSWRSRAPSSVPGALRQVAVGCGETSRPLRHQAPDPSGSRSSCRATVRAAFHFRTGQRSPRSSRAQFGRKNK